MPALFAKPIALSAAVMCLGALYATPDVTTAQTSGAAAIPAARALVTQSVDTNQRFILADHRAAWAGTQNDRGAVPGDLPMSQLTITLNRSPEREQAFQQLLKDQQDPTSPQYHHWLTPVEVGQQYGAAQQDIDAISAWLAAQGLHVDNVSNGRTLITFSGSASVVAKAFATPIHYYQVDGETRIANTDDPQIPVALAPAVMAVNGLHTIKFRPAHSVRALQGKAAAASKPADTYCPRGNSSCVYTVFPTDFAKIYDIAGVPSNITGSGQTIVIVGKSRVLQADLTNFALQSMGSSTFVTPKVIIPTALGGVDPGDPATTCTSGSTGTCEKPTDALSSQQEATLDVERAGSIAPGAAINLVVSADSSSGTDGLNFALQYAIDKNALPGSILSLSFASCESGPGGNGQAITQSLDRQFQQAASEGISVFAASGDSGVAGCETPFVTPTSGQTASINTFCASSAVTCVGGTEFADTANPSQYWAANDGDNFLSALGYITEGAWNEPLDDNNNPTVAGGGGGPSAYISTPSWQTGIPGTQGRYTPDVAFTASSHDSYFGCMAAAGGSCVAGSDGSFSFTGFAGTSASTPSMAGIAALLNQKMGSAQGNLNPRLYALAATPSNGVFHDVTVASSGVSGCGVSVPSICNNTTAGPNGLSGGVQGYLVGPGYDMVTGLGSIDVAKLLAAWGSGGTTPAVNLNQHGLTGNWYNPAAGGQGLQLESVPDQSGLGKGVIFAPWFTYDTTASGAERWYSLFGNVTPSSTSVSLTINVNTGGNFNAAPQTSATAIGSATMTFSDCTHASLSYHFNDGSRPDGTIALTRLDNNVTCSAAGDTGPAPDGYGLSGNWYNPTISGQGFVFDVNPNNNLFFATWFTYAPNGQGQGTAGQRWYVIQDNFTAGMTAKSNMPISEYSGGTFNSQPGNGVQVGTASITFNSCSSATLTYSFTGGTNAGKSGLIALTRLLNTPAGCSL